MPIHAGKLLLDALDSHWDTYRKRLKTCRHDISEDAVHKLRTSTRRLLSLIELLRTLQPHPTLNKLRKTLKTQLDGFDELRDTQVMLLEIGNTVEILPELTPFLRHLQQHEQHLRLQTQAFIKTLSIGKLKPKLKKARSRCKQLTIQKDVDTAVLAAIDGVYATIMSRYQAVDPMQLASIHHLRIAVKKLRYMLASVQTMLPGLSEDHLKQLQTYLTRMGDIQNSAVLLRVLENFFVAGMPATILQHYHRQQQELIGTFLVYREEIFEFWRKSSKQNLPWEPDIAGVEQH